MYRRRHRPERPAAFSFDAFLDVVTNVVGIILRLILVAWVGARTYKGPPPPELPPLPEPAVAVFTPPAEDSSLVRELEARRAELAGLRDATLEALRNWEADRSRREAAAREVTALRQQRQEAQSRRPDVAGQLAAQHRLDEKTAVTMAELQERNQKLRAELEELQKAPRATKQLTYRLPVSAPVQTEELFLECRAGRVSVIDIAALLDDIEASMRGRAEQLRTTWSVEDTTRPHGAFRLRYTLERERGLLEGAGLPSERGGFRYGLAGWVVEPVEEERGETADVALKPGSQLRKVLDRLDPKQTVVTLWVYPDSFALYRRLRDHLHERDLVVAGRPLPDGVPIGSSRKGTSSRGQ